IFEHVSAAYLGSGIIVSLEPPIGTCGPSNVTPLSDRRAYGWCRFGELITECGGWPAWQYFIPVGKAYISSSSIFPLAFPEHFSPDDKGVLYNHDAYCFVRSQKLYKQCTLQNMITKKLKQIPDFPRPAIVIKTAWKSESEMNADGKD